MSLIADSHLSAQELYHLRYLFAKHSGIPQSTYGTIFLFLWNTYGFNFSNSLNSLLRYSTMAFAALSSRVGRSIPSEYYEYFSKFHKGLLRDIKENTIDESNLFALYFTSMCALEYSREIDMEEPVAFHIYRNIFCAATEHLLGRRIEYSLPQIWRFMLFKFILSYVDTHTCTTVMQDSDIQLYSMQLFEKKIPGMNNILTVTNQVITPSCYTGTIIDSYSIHHY
jgi:hypothetical protein